MSTGVGLRARARASWRGAYVDPVASAGAAVAATFFLNGFGFGSWAARIPAIRDHAGLSHAALGIMLACIPVGAIIAMPISGLLASRHGSRLAVRVSLAATALALALPGFAGSLLALAPVALLLGAANGALDVTMNAHGVAVERRLGRRILGRLHAAFSFGGLAGAGTGALAAGAGLDVRVHLSLVAVVVGVIGLVWTRRLLPGSVDVRDESTPAFVRPPRQLWALGALAFACLLLEGASADWSSIFLRDELKLGVGSAALGYTAFSLAMAIGRLEADRLTARLGAVRLVRRGGLLAVGGLLVVLLPGQAAAAVAGFACLGAGLAAVVPSVFRAASQASALPASVALAAVSSAGYLGFLVGPPLIGGLAQIVGLRAALFLLVALAVAATMLAPSVATSSRFGVDPEPRAAEPCPA